MKSSGRGKERVVAGRYKVNLANSQIAHQVSQARPCHTERNEECDKTTFQAFLNTILQVQQGLLFSFRLGALALLLPPLPLLLAACSISTISSYTIPERPISVI